MAKLLMITGDRALAEGKHGAFYNTLEEFHKHWERIDIICPGVSNFEFRASDFSGKVEIHPSPWSLIFQPLWIFKKGLEIFKKERFDLMTVHEYPPFYNGIGARLLWHKIKIPYLVEIFHIPGFPEHSNIKELLYRSLVRVFISYDVSRAKAVRTMNTEVVKFLESSGVPKGKIKLIPAIYVDLDVFKPINIPKEYDVIFVGRLEANKGIDLFLETVKKLDCKAVIVGDGNLSGEVKLKIENWKLKITLHGWAKDQNEVASLINRARLLVMPSYNEGGPRVVIEAMACGVPVLATPVGIVPDLLKNSLGGEIIDWDAEDIAQKIAGLLADSEAYKKHSLAGLEIAQKFEKKTAIGNYAAKIKALI